MQAQIHTVAFRGIETIDVTVQIHLGSGLPAMTIVGLADKAVAESRERVRAALSSLGLALPPKRIAINLALADVVKEGAHFDLPIAAGLMVAMGALPQDALDNLLVLGELGLDRARLSARGYHKVLRVARTIADMAASDIITRPALAESLAYRAMPLLA